MRSFKTTALAAAVLLAMSSGVVQAQSSNEIQSLKGTVEDLRKQLNELRALIKQWDAAAPGAGGDIVAKEGESPESVEARTPATRAEISGLRADIENYKYDQSRLQERTIPSVTRNTKIGGSITARYDYQDEAVTPTNSGGITDPRKQGFAPLAFALNFGGNLFRDYAEGRDLTYRLALSGANSAGTTTTSLTDAYTHHGQKRRWLRDLRQQPPLALHVRGQASGTDLGAERGAYGTHCGQPPVSD